MSQTCFRLIENHQKLSEEYREMINKIIKDNKWITILSIIIFAFLSYYPPDIQPDSPGYINADVCRGLLYPTFLHFMELIFGKWYVPVVVLQHLTGIWATLYTISKLAHWFNLNRFIQVIIFITLLLPYIGHTRIGVVIMTEAICYPLFMLFFIHLFESIHTNNKKYFYYSLLWAVLMMLTRKQFSLFFGGFYLVLLLEFFTYKRFNIIKWVSPLLVFIAGLTAEYSYVYHKTGCFNSTPFYGQYIAAPLFIAKNENIEQLSDQRQKEFLKNALIERNKAQVGLKDPIRTEYELYTPIHMYFEIVHDFFRFRAAPNALNQIQMPHNEQDDFIKKISFDLIKLNFSNYLWLYRSTLIHGLGGYYPVFILSLFFMLSSICFIRFKNQICLFMSLAAFLEFFNYSIVSLMQPILRRYVFYTDTFYVVGAILLITLLFDFIKKQSLCK